MYFWRFFIKSIFDLLKEPFATLEVFRTRLHACLASTSFIVLWHQVSWFWVKAQTAVWASLRVCFQGLYPENMLCYLILWKHFPKCILDFVSMCNTCKNDTEFGQKYFQDIDKNLHCLKGVRKGWKFLWFTDSAYLTPIRHFCNI